MSLDNVAVTVSVPLRDVRLPSAVGTLVELGKAPFAALASCGGKRKEGRSLSVLGGVTATLSPGTSTLVLGAPGAGKSSLLRAVSGYLPVDKDESLRYNGAPISALTSAGISLRKLAAYAPQIDDHFPLLTVRETLTFAHACANAPLPANAPAAATAAAKRAVDDIISVLGLTECENTMIGDAQTRGISGGQKRRVTIGACVERRRSQPQETDLVKRPLTAYSPPHRGPAHLSPPSVRTLPAGEVLLTGARILALDEVTNGLDAVTAVAVMSYVTEWAHKANGTVIAALQAPTPEVFDLFDNVLLLSEVC